MLQNCDHIKAISSLLGHCGQQHTATATVSTQTSQQSNIEQETKVVAEYINSRMHEQAKVLTKTYQDSPQKIRSLNLRDFIQTLDPTLLNFIKAITQPVRKNAGNCNSRSIRQLYSLCTLLFCTNSKASMPIHVLLTEMILCHGGSFELVKIMNRIGAVACVDTANRLSTQVAQDRIVHSIHTALYPNTLTVVSIDNIDILQPHAIVSCTDATRSWHGTSVQCTQPRPQSQTTDHTDNGNYRGAHNIKEASSFLPNIISNAYIKTEASK